MSQCGLNSTASYGPCLWVFYSGGFILFRDSGGGVAPYAVMCGCAHFALRDRCGEAGGHQGPAIFALGFWFYLRVVRFFWVFDICVGSVVIFLLYVDRYASHATQRSIVPDCSVITIVGRVFVAILVTSTMVIIERGRGLVTNVGSVAMALFPVGQRVLLLLIG